MLLIIIISLISIFILYMLFGSTGEYIVQGSDYENDAYIKSEIENKGFNAGRLIKLHDIDPEYLKYSMCQTYSLINGILWTNIYNNKLFYDPKKNTKDIILKDLVTIHYNTLEKQEITNKCSSLLNTKIDLSVQPSPQIHIFKTTDNEWHILIFSAHCSADGISISVFLQCSFIIYKWGFAGLCAIYLLKLLGYFKSKTDYVNYMKHNYDYNKDKAYWNSIYNKNTQYITPLPLSQQNIETFYYETDSKKIELFVRKNDTTLFIFVVSIMKCILHNLLDLNEIVISYPSNSRPPDFDYLIGNYANVLLLKTIFTNEKTFGEILKKITKQRYEVHIYY